jgi:hypothetical protein
LHALLPGGLGGPRRVSRALLEQSTLSVLPCETRSFTTEYRVSSWPMFYLGQKPGRTRGAAQEEHSKASEPHRINIMNTHFMDAQPNRNSRRRKRRKNQNRKPAAKIEPVVVAARRPDSPRLEKPTRRMKAASAKPRALREDVAVAVTKEPIVEAPKKRRDARIVQRKEDEIDDTERTRRRLLSRYLAAEGRAAITHAADAYFKEGFELPLEQDAQLKLLEHFDEARAGQALSALTTIFEEDDPIQLPILRQRLRRLEDHAEDVSLRSAATELRRRLPA